jgi:serine/threonine protein kinase
VLVDFGLAGRKLRPGCATGNYGAPEIWGLVPQGYEPRPMAADTYAFGCIVYETLTGRTLFDDTNEMALITKHCSHDGRPEGIAVLEQSPKLTPLARIVTAALRRDPRHRAAMRDVRRALAQVGATFESTPSTS